MGPSSAAVDRLLRFHLERETERLVTAAWFDVLGR
jgi:hypothetical protein